MPKKARATIREKNPTTKIVDAVVSADELGAILADPPLGDRWLRQMADEGFLSMAGRGRYHLAASVRGYIARIRETEVERARDSSTSRELFEAERARKLKLENDKREALLVETPDAIAAIDAILGQVRTALASIAPRYTEDVAERRRLEDAIDAVLSDLADRLDQAGAALATGRDPLEADAAAVG